MSYNDNDFDEDVLSSLLANDSDTEDDKNEKNVQPVPTTLKELPYNFLDDVSNNIQNVNNSHEVKDSFNYLENAQDFSDEDKCNFEAKTYYEFDRNKIQFSTNQDLKKASKSDTNFNSVKKINNLSNVSRTNNLTSKNSNDSSYESIIQTQAKGLKKHDATLQVPSSNLSSKKDVYSDPIFGIKIIRPMISSAELTSSMNGRRAITVSQVKEFLKNQDVSNITEDWVIAGIVINKFTKTSQNGNQYCLLKLSDLSMDMKTVSIFLFKSAYKNLWKTAIGTVLGVLNPSIFDSNDTDQATLSIDNPQRVMIFGTSRDFGKCKSMKKNGDPCSAPVNLSRCEYCVYHVKQEYNKFSKRSDLQSPTTGRSAFKSSVFPKKERLSQPLPLIPGVKPFVGIAAKRNEKQYAKDTERLALLRGSIKVEISNTKEKESQNKARLVDLTANQSRKDSERLNKLRNWGLQKNPLLDIPLGSQSPSNVLSQSPKLATKSLTKDSSLPKLNSSLLTSKIGSKYKEEMIDLSQPIPQAVINKTKQKAIEWVKNNGPIQKVNPNKMHDKKDILIQKGIKRKRIAEKGDMEAAETLKKKKSAQDKFQELMEMKSAHVDLLEKRDTEETEKYFGKLEMKERLEEKMLTTFKVECKAVRCSVCKYVAFSSSELCKKLQHPIKVIDAVKSFFKCADCGNRTISLDKLPKETCKRCMSSRWVRAPMMDEKKTEISKSALSIRGAEEKFIGSVTKNANLDLLVPDE